MSGNGSGSLQVVQQAYRNFQTGNMQDLLAQFARDIEWSLPAIENVRISGARRGAGEVMEFFRMLGEDQAAVQFEPREFIADGDDVVALGHYKWTVAQTGKQWESDFVHVFTVRNGQVVRFRELMDTAAAAAAYRA